MDTLYHLAVYICVLIAWACGLTLLALVSHLVWRAIERRWPDEPSLDDLGEW